MPQFRPAARRPVIAVSASLLAVTLITGCSTDNPMHQALSESVSFGGPSEAGFLAMVERDCAQESVGAQSVAPLMQSDTTFRQLASRLYRGDISTDTFGTLVLQEYPATDANVPTIGCVARQLNACMNSKCDGSPVATPVSIESEAIDDARDETLDQVAAGERDEVDELLADPVDSVPTMENSPIDVAPEPSVPAEPVGGDGEAATP
jgi:hypothetical protein